MPPASCRLSPKPAATFSARVSAGAARNQEFSAGGCRIARFTYAASRQRTGGVISRSRFFATIFTDGPDCAPDCAGTTWGATEFLLTGVAHNVVVLAGPTGGATGRHVDL